MINEGGTPVSFAPYWFAQSASVPVWWPAAQAWCTAASRRNNSTSDTRARPFLDSVGQDDG